MIKNAKNISDAQFSLIVCGQSLCFDEIAENLHLKSTRAFHKGDCVTKLPEIVAQEDAWYHTEQLTEPEGEDRVLQKLLEKIYAAKDYLQNLSANGMTVTLRLSVNSDKAFIGYRLTPTTLESIQKIGLPLDITTVSWGEVGL